MVAVDLRRKLYPEIMSRDCAGRSTTGLIAFTAPGMGQPIGGSALRREPVGPQLWENAPGILPLTDGIPQFQSAIDGLHTIEIEFAPRGQKKSLRGGGHRIGAKPWLGGSG